MSEQTTLLSEDELTEIGSVLKLAPHVKSSQFETVIRSTEDEPLVSLDELYEKTGQESINNIINGFKCIQEKNKLSRAHGLALKVQGAESWVPLPDTLNIIKGGEGFFTAFKDKIISIIKAIIKFIAGIYNWIADRIKRLFGLEKTVDQAKFLNENTAEVNSKVSDVVGILGGGKDYSPEALFLTLPKGELPEAQFTLVKKRLDSYEDTFTRLGKTLPAFEEATQALLKISSNANNANSSFNRFLADLKSKFKRQDVSVADVQRFISYLNTEFFVTLDYQSAYDIVELLYKEFYNIEIKGLGIEGGINKARSYLKDNVEFVKTKLTPAQTTKAAEAARTLSAKLVNFKSNGTNAENMKFSERVLKQFKDIVNVPDAEFIKLLSEKVPVNGVGNLLEVYVAFCNKVKDYTLTIEILLNSIQEISKTYFNLFNWYSRLSVTMASYVTGDIKKILEAHEKYLTPEERKQAENDKGVPIGLMDMEESFNRKHPGWNIPEDTSYLLKSIQEVDQVSRPLNKFITTMRG